MLVYLFQCLKYDNVLDALSDALYLFLLSAKDDIR